MYTLDRHLRLSATVLGMQYTVYSLKFLIDVLKKNKHNGESYYNYNSYVQLTFPSIFRNIRKEFGL